MYTITLTKQEISQTICGELCMMAESMQDGPIPKDGKFILVYDWDGSGRNLTVTYDIMMIGYHYYGTDRIPKFIESNWDRALKIYKRLKGL